jgi:hypothetical protein
MAGGWALYWTVLLPVTYVLNFASYPQDMDVSTADYALLYALYSWPNVVLSCLGGYLIDKVFGIRWADLLKWAEWDQ